MDKFIESFAERSTPQKILITLGVSTVLLIIIGASYLFTTPNTKTTAIDSAPDEVPTPTSAEIILDAQPNSTWPVHAGDGYQISYPKELSASPGVINGGSGGTALSLSGREGDIEYNIEIQVTPSTLTPIENIYALFRTFKFEEKEVLTGGVNSKAFEGRKSDYQESIVVLENRGKVYKLQLIYVANEQDMKIEQLFEGMLSTFKLI